jgi:hypothetical protein
MFVIIRINKQGQNLDSNIHPIYNYVAKQQPLNQSWAGTCFGKSEPLVSDSKNPTRTGFDFQNQNQILCFEELDPESDSQFHLCLESVLMYFGALDILHVRTICNTALNTGLPGKYREKPNTLPTPTAPTSMSWEYR